MVEHANILEIYETRRQVTATGRLITTQLEKHIMSPIQEFGNQVEYQSRLNQFQIKMYRIPEISRQFLYKGDIVVSYRDHKIVYLVNTKKPCILELYYEIYADLYAYKLQEILVMYQYVYYYRKSSTQKGLTEGHKGYKIYQLIIKNIIYFIWALEYSYYQDSSKILNRPEKINDRMQPLPLLTLEEYKQGQKYQKLKKNEAVYESIDILSNLYKVKDVPTLCYVDYKENKALIKLGEEHNKNIKIFEKIPRPKQEVIQEYLSDLVSYIERCKSEGNTTSNKLDILENRTVYYELEQAINALSIE